VDPVAESEGQVMIEKSYAPLLADSMNRFSFIMISSSSA
jgi:hypothetical protein